MEGSFGNPQSPAEHCLRNHSVFLEAKQHKTQRRRSGQSLHEHDLLVGSGTSVKSSDDHTAKEECLKLLSHKCIRVNKPPEESSGQEAIVEALVCGHSLGLSGERGRQVEGLLSAGSRPEEHLKGHDVDVFESHQAGTCESEKTHCERIEGCRMWLFGVASDLNAAVSERMGVVLKGDDFCCRSIVTILNFSRRHGID